MLLRVRAVKKARSSVHGLLDHGTRASKIGVPADSLPVLFVRAPKSYAEPFEGRKRASQIFRLLEALLMEEESIPSPKTGVNIVRTFERDGVSYEFYTKPCSCCEELLYFIGRVDGVRVSCFQIWEEKIEDVELLVDELHESFAIDVKTILEALKTSINDITRLVGFNGFFDTNGMSNYRIRTLDRARLILKKFNAEGKLDYLEQHGNSIDDDLSAAFVLGYLACDNWWTVNHENAVIEGYRHQEAREVGRPLAVDARLRIGRRSRQAVINAAKEIYKKEPKLREMTSDGETYFPTQTATLTQARWHLIGRSGNYQAP